ncbi:hypothetical protein PR202_gb10034 [Eleusine coracana subsp. coracana]|uniref:Uncharacterized protein n=1 Tax=Eleusine coracana subsp. coracana TaxID=191504 RepID=A0AAV5EJW6_ELECO|nr:hypothetical protein PR202_gb10034 [Eleusine coracana subsp. coracana]
MAAPSPSPASSPTESPEALALPIQRTSGGPARRVVRASAPGARGGWATALVARAGAMAADWRPDLERAWESRAAEQRPRGGGPRHLRGARRQRRARRRWWPAAQDLRRGITSCAMSPSAEGGPKGGTRAPAGGAAERSSLVELSSSVPRGSCGASRERRAPGRARQAMRNPADGGGPELRWGRRRAGAELATGWSERKRSSVFFLTDGSYNEIGAYMQVCTGVGSKIKLPNFANGLAK